MTDLRAAGEETDASDWTEADRLATLLAYRILDTAPEQAFQDIVDLAATMLRAPMAVVNLIASDRQWFKARRGMPMQETGVDVSLCAQLLRQPGLTVVPDLRDDARFACNPFVAPETGVRFYAGALLVSPAGHPLGTLCVLDTEPRPTGLTPEQGASLLALARQTMAQIELRRAMQQITEDRAALLASEAKFRAITDSIDQMVWSCGAEGGADFYNQRWYDYTGVAPGTGHGHGWLTLLHPDDEARTLAAWDRSVLTGSVYHVEYRLQHRSGVFRWMLARAQPVRDDAGRIVRWYGTCTEIEALVQAREVLARSRRELEREITRRTAERDQIWRNTQDLVLVIDGTGLLRAANPAWSTMLGWDPHAVVGATYLDFVHPDDIPLARAAFARALAGTGTVFELRKRCKDGGYRTIAWRCTLHDGVLYATGRDVTDERAAAVALAAMQDQVRHAQKMDAVGQLTGGIAHDFNNMLSVVIGSLDLLERRLPEDAARERRYVDAAMSGARRAALLTERLMAFARQQPLHPDAVDANGLITGMMDLVRHAVGVEPALRTVLADDLWAAHVDPNQLENALLNLAVNARDAILARPDGPGELVIETRNVTLDASHAGTHPDMTPGAYVVVAVADTGCGMSPAVMARAFEPFFTTKDANRGTGLGLSQVYGFAKQSGGHVALSSEPGAGTTVRLYLPRSAGARPAIAPPEPATLPQHGGREVVLVVEDQPAVRRVSVEALAALGYAVLEADGGVAALAIVAAHPELGLLFTDIMMPDMDGRTLANAAHRLRPELPVLLTTGYAGPASGEAGAPLGSLPVLPKPFTLSELAGRVRAVLDAAPRP